MNLRCRLPGFNFVANYNSSSSPFFFTTILRCNIDVRHASSLSAEEFVADYFLKKPVIIHGSFNLAHAIQVGVAKRAWSQRQLVEKYGNASVVARKSGEYQFTQSQKSDETKVTLAELFASFDGGAYDWLAFDRGTPEDPKAPLFHEANELLPLANALFEYYFNSTVDDQNWIFSASSQGGGVHFHQHTDAYCILFEGAKRWFLYPPSKLPEISMALHTETISMHSWYNELVYPMLKEEELPVECLQRPGDIFYVPEYWWHATLQPSGVEIGATNTTIAVAASNKNHQSRFGRMYSEAFQAKEYSIFEQILKEFDGNVPALYMLGQLYSIGDAADRMPIKLKQYRNREIKALERAYELQPSQCDIRISLGRAYIRYEEIVKAKAVLTQCNAICGHFRKECAEALADLTQKGANRRDT